jgi:hypothetical protein
MAGTFGRGGRAGVAYQVYWTHFMPRRRTPSMPCGKSAAFQHTTPSLSK